uniref:Histone deacetylase 14 n=1 Tax=Tanacetum cinerariifolium TaxID=118510 RepID=A0A6L2P070_TANCI|nr:histone deacetylase 14 [Tanacetum cinerariifolium]
MCLTGKTSRFERPRAPVLQILWGAVTQAHIDYAKRNWEEFTQSIHTFIDDKRNLAQHIHKKKKATLIMIPKPVLGYLKFSAKGTKREVFGMPIPSSLSTADIQEASYYQEYLAKVAKHQRYLAGETGSDPDSPVLKPTKTARKPKPTVPKAHPRPSVLKPVTSTQPEPKYAPANTQGKKRKPTTKMFDKLSKAIKSRPGLVTKKRKPINTLRYEDELVAEDVPYKEPQVNDEEADEQRALEESLKSMYDVAWGPLPPVFIRKPESEKYQPLLEVPGKGKEKVIEEQVSHDLLNLQTPKKEPYGSIHISEESVEDVPRADAGGQGKGQAGSDPSAQDEGQAKSNPDEQIEGQDGPDPGNAKASQPMSSHVVHAGSDHEHIDLDVSDVMLEEPASSSRTLSSLHHLTKDLSFGDLFFSDKPSEADNDKSTAETEAESMVSVTIQQDTSSIPLMTTPIINITSRPESPKVHHLLKATAIKTTTITTTILPPPSQQQQSITDAMMMKHIGELEHIMTNLIQENKRLEQRLDSHGARLYTLEQLDIPPLELAKDLAEVRKKKKKSRESPKTPPGSPLHQPPLPPPPAGPSGALGSPGASGSSHVPPPPPSPPSTNQEGRSKGSAAPSSSKTAASAECQAWMTTDIKLRPSILFTPADLQMDDDMAPNEQAQSFDDEDIRDAYIPKTGDNAMFMDWFCKRRGIIELKPQDLEGLAFEIIKVFHPDGSKPTMSISKMKAAYYPDVGLEQMVPDQMWIKEECKYDIATMYGISYRWFQRQHFYIDRHISKGDRRAVRTYTWILSVVRIEVFLMYGYDYMKKIVLRQADLNEHVIAERDFKYLYPSDFEDLYLLNLQGHLNHLPPKDKKILTTAVNLWTRHLVIRQ